MLLHPGSLLLGNAVAVEVVKRLISRLLQNHLQNGQKFNRLGQEIIAVWPSLEMVMNTEPLALVCLLGYLDRFLGERGQQMF